MTSRAPLALIGEEIAGPWNASALADIARAFGGRYHSYAGEDEGGPDLLSRFDRLVAAENVPNAEPVYTFRPSGPGRCALLVGNEAKGLRRRTLKRANAVVEIPLVSRNVNCLNVAAAAAVLLYYLALPEPLALRRRTLAAVQKDRPGLMLVGGPDPMELGSTLRSACAFGWDRVFLLDRCDSWYACDRMIKSQGRGAARRGRNPLRVIPCQADHLNAYERIVICTTQPHGRPIHRSSLIGPKTLIVLEDEAAPASWRPERSSAEILYAALPPALRAAYHYRQAASLALAEIARQLGQPEGEGLYLRGRRDRYRKEVEAEAETGVLDLEDLLQF